MAYSERLGRRERLEAAALLGRRAPELASDGAALAESFLIWRLEEAGPAGSDGPLRSRLISTGTWYHQVVRPGGQPASLLAAGPRDESGRLDAGLFDANPLAEKIDAAVYWADEHLDHNWEARLVFLPRLLAHVFLFTNGEQELLYPVSVPGNPSMESTLVEDQMLFATLAPSDWPSEETTRE